MARPSTTTVTATVTPTQSRSVNSGDVLVRVDHVSHSFGATRALKDVSLNLRAGRIHALVGENGAGKSTMLGLLAGRIPLSCGTIEVDGNSLVTGHPRISRAAGIVAIYQELTTIPALPAYENVFLGQQLARGPLASHAAMRRRFPELCEEMNVSIPANARAGDLAVADRQLLEIMRGIQAGARILLFDEPTAALAPREREALFAVMRRLRDRGAALAFVSHNLDEVIALSDEVSVFRDGRIVAEGAVAEWTEPKLVTAMLGKARDVVARSSATPLAKPPTALLTGRGVAMPGLLYPIDLEIRAGEVLGIAGLVGSGRSSLLRTLAGLEHRAEGTLTIDGQEHRVPRHPRAARKLGLALLPEDRKHQGLVMQQSAAINIVLPDFGQVARGGVLRSKKLMQEADRAAGLYGFDKVRLQSPAAQLSGGNQQKLLLARWRFALPRILLADEPTRGIDVGAKAEILTALRAAAGDGLAVVVVSSDLEEITAISDRVLVMRDGHAVSTFDCHAVDIDVDLILRTAFAVDAGAETQTALRGQP